MKIKFTTLALLAVLSLPLGSCQKENFGESSELCDKQTASIWVSYCIDGTKNSTTLESEKSWYDFLSKMIALAREGHEVSFSRGERINVRGQKEQVTFTTSSEQQALQWSNEMTAQGFVVTITYNERTGIYTCIAIR